VQADRNARHPPPPAGRRGEQRVRIIGGRWRRRILRFPDVPTLRPTPDRVRETLFNWLGQDLTDLATLDLFAGSGALSFEALSRGARLAVAVDRSAEAVVALRRNAAALGAAGLEARAADAADFLRAETRRFDVVFIDPPFAESWLERIWPLILPRLAGGAWVYVEQPAALVAPDRWEVVRRGQAGRVHYHLLRAAPAADSRPS
jgi:16S rRNA (guanine(966)-N(2))-methyltransferase RsmD